MLFATQNKQRRNVTSLQMNTCGFWKNYDFVCSDRRTNTPVDPESTSQNHLGCMYIDIHSKLHHHFITWEVQNETKYIPTHPTPPQKKNFLKIQGVPSPRKNHTKTTAFYSRFGQPNKSCEDEAKGRWPPYTNPNFMHKKQGKSLRIIPNICLIPPKWVI